jgi:WhiB family redox-sensing transcriptional regulator
MMANPRYRIFEERDLMTWRDNGACLDEDPELFFANGNTGPALRQIEEAKAVCRRCEVIDTCLRWAIESRQETGVWGGLSEDERRTLKRRNARDSSLRLTSTAPPRRGSSSVR